MPLRIRREIEVAIGQDYMKLEEIRLRINCPVILKFNDVEKVLRETINEKDIKECLQYICENSIYAYQNELNQGYITIRGGHRIGITGNCVIENNKIINISYVYSMNFRISKEIIGAANEIIKYIINKENDIFSCLIVSPPGAGKTTILRDLIRQLSNGIKEINFNGKNVSVVDERGELAAMYKGVPQNNLGIRTDILDNIPKSLGMEMLIRSMSPEIIVADEIGNPEEIDTIIFAISSGIKGIFTAHGDCIEDLYSKKCLRELINLNIFKIIVFLDKHSKGKIKSIIHFNNESSKSTSNE